MAPPAPNFMVIGASRCGTTSLCDLLGAHPEIYVSEAPKEINYFCYDDLFARGWDWYLTHFAAGEGCKAVGEGSTQYSQTHVNAHTVDRIAERLPDVKLIYMVRSPLKRMESLWRHWLAEPVPGWFHFNAAVRGQWPLHVESSRYWTEISRFRAKFADEQILVVFFEDFAADPQAELRRCCRFLGVRDDFTFPEPERPRNTSGDRTAEGGLIKFARRSKLAHAVGAVTPWRLRQWLWRNLRREMPAKAQWNPQTRRRVVETIADDVAQFLDFYGKPRDYWRLDA